MRRFFFTASGDIRAPWRILLFLAVAFAAAAMLAPLFATAATALGRTGLADLQVTTGAAVTLGLIAAHVVMMRFVEKRNWRDVGLHMDALRARPMLVGTAAGLAAIGIPSLLLLLSPWLSIETLPGGLAAWTTYAILMAAFLLGPALSEELLFRGYPFLVMREAAGVPVAVAVTSVVFGVVHVANPGAAALPIMMVTLAGFFLAGVLLLTGSLWAAWIAHLAWNWTLAALLHVEVSGFLPMEPPSYRTVDAGPDWLTGGAWGPEGGVLAGLGMISILRLLHMRQTRRERLQA